MGSSLKMVRWRREPRTHVERGFHSDNGHLAEKPVVLVGFTRSKWSHGKWPGLEMMKECVCICQ